MTTRGSEDETVNGVSFSNNSIVSNNRRDTASTATSTSLLNLFAKTRPPRSYILTKRQWLRIAACILYFTVGCIFYAHFEGWSINTSIAFTIVTMATVGYGYNHPTNNNSRLFTMFYIIVGVYFLFLGFAQQLSKRLDRVVTYIHTVSDANNLFAAYNFHKKMMAYNIAAIILVILLGGFILTMLEDWSFIEGVYFALETSTTVGYGDLTITHQSTHLFLGAYIIFSTILFSFAINNFQVLRAQRRQLDKIEKTKLRAKDLHFLVGMDQGDGVTEDQFILAILKHLGKVDQENDIDPWLMKFRELKRDTEGKVYKETLLDFSVRESMQQDNALAFNDMLSPSASIHSGFTLSFSSFAGVPYYPSRKEITTTTQREMITRSSNLVREDLDASLVHNQHHIA